VDSKEGHVVIDAWRTKLSMTAVEAIRELEPYFGGFLYTHFDREGLLQGTDMGAITLVRNATSREITAAGGITTMEEVNELAAMRVDAVVGMALYTGRLALPDPPAASGA
jgi:phosphoribosylformimino-5-aminoimidazole carboxamide ribonucleotide (ProFAR) isomerase